MCVCGLVFLEDSVIIERSVDIFSVGDEFYLWRNKNGINTVTISESLFICV